ncbi:uncharacterized protein I303_104321 [Kwoniella dejecticola CBS 10117]|uniref:Exosome complex protein n=1 Tax=Kwoniella dejecticola CBS 10117 TaxID=1296121 RepID=A0A1A6A5N4_9TREE|nr:uncharacterized protein I303_04705 [Kwoniella dejecticola CBS 10117]OBR85370.1 hypothetical protein I303_04705 [Kwoniella dejecticola CBS 10117]
MSVAVQAQEADADPKQTLESLTSALGVLEKSLESLLEGEAIDSAWNDKLGKLDTMDRAKMDVLASYTINDLIWGEYNLSCAEPANYPHSHHLYLKLRGVDPEKHEVSSELNRIRTYYTKIKQIENPNDTQRARIDSKAAHRFVKASIPQSQHLPQPHSQTSAAQLAQQQAQSAVAEQEEEASLRRLGKASRFRFIEQEGKERLIPGQERDLGDQEEDMEEDEDQDEGKDEDADEQEDVQGNPEDTEEEVEQVEMKQTQGRLENQNDAEEFLRGVEEEMRAQ